MKVLYVTLTNKCQLNCPFCFNKFVDNFKYNSSLLQSDTAINNILNKDPDIVSFIGGEPLLYPELMIKIMNYFRDKDIKNNRKRCWCVSSNLYYNDLYNQNNKKNKERIECLKLMQDISDEEVTIGTSYTIDRFNTGPKDYFKVFKDNMLYLDSIGLRVGVTVTITKEQIKQPVEELKRVLESVKYKCVNIERCIYPYTRNENNIETLNEFYKKTDEYILNCFKIFPKEMNYQYDRFYQCAKFKIPFANPQCSKETWSVYYNGLTPCCPLNNTNDIDLLNRRLQDKYKKYKCLECDYFPYCRGDCECNRSVCAFPKKTIDYMIKVVKEENESKI